MELLCACGGLEIGIGGGFTESLVGESIGESAEDIAFLEGIEGGERESVFVPTCRLSEGKGGFGVLGGLEGVAEGAGMIASVGEMDGEAFDIGRVFGGEFVCESAVDVLEAGGVVMFKEGDEDLTDTFVIKVDLFVFLGIAESDQMLEAELADIGGRKGEIERAQEQVACGGLAGDSEDFEQGLLGGRKAGVAFFKDFGEGEAGEDRFELLFPMGRRDGGLRRQGRGWVRK